MDSTINRVPYLGIGEGLDCCKCLLMVVSEGIVEGVNEGIK